MNSNTGLREENSAFVGSIRHLLAPIDCTEELCSGCKLFIQLIIKEYLTFSFIVSSSIGWKVQYPYLRIIED